MVEQSVFIFEDPLTQKPNDTTLQWDLTANVYYIIHMF